MQPSDRDLRKIDNACGGPVFASLVTDHRVQIAAAFARRASVRSAGQLLFSLL